MSDLVRTAFSDGIYSITLDHPPANALTLEMIRLLQAAFKEVSQLKAARLVLLRGAGENFSGGQDIYEILKARGNHIGSICRRPTTRLCFKSGALSYQCWLKFVARLLAQPWV